LEYRETNLPRKGKWKRLPILGWGAFVGGGGEKDFQWNEPSVALNQIEWIKRKGAKMKRLCQVPTKGYFWLWHGGEGKRQKKLANGTGLKSPVHGCGRKDYRGRGARGENNQ